MANAWDKREQETIKSYRAFQEYLQLGYKRSFPKLAGALELKSTASIRQWSVTFDWQERAAKYDEYKARMERDEALVSSIKAGTRAIDVIRCAIEVLFDKIVKEKAFHNMPADKLAMIVSSLIKTLPSLTETRQKHLTELVDNFVAQTTKLELGDDFEYNEKVIEAKNMLINAINNTENDI